MKTILRFQKFINEMPLHFQFLGEEPQDKNKISRAKAAATRKFCRVKNSKQHEERRKQPPGPQKPVSFQPCRIN